MEDPIAEASIELPSTEPPTEGVARRPGGRDPVGRRQWPSADRRNRHSVGTA